MINYQIRIIGELIETPLEWEFTLVNSMFSTERVLGVRSYEIQVSSSVQTRRLFGHINDPRRQHIPQTLDAVIEMGGVLVDSGKVIIRQSGSNFLLSYTSNISKVFGSLAGRSMREFDIGSDDFSANPDLALDHDWEDGYTLPQVANSKFYGGDNPVGFNGKINERSGAGLTGTAYCPMVFLKYVLNAWADEAGITFKGSFWTATELEEALFYSNVTAAAAFEFQRILPEMTIEACVMQLRILFNLWVRVDVLQRSITIDFIKDIVSQVPERDWSSKFGRIDNGEPVVTSGLAFSVRKDSGDDLMNAADFDEYLSINEDGDFPHTDIVAQIAGLSNLAGVPAISQEGYFDEKQGKDAGTRILFYDTATKTSRMTVGGVAIMPADLVGAYWDEWNEFLKNSYRFKGPVNLDGGDIANMAALFRGTDNGIPIVYAQGLNWLIESITVPTSGLPEIVMWRI